MPPLLVIAPPKSGRPANHSIEDWRATALRNGANALNLLDTYVCTLLLRRAVEHAVPPSAFNLACYRVTWAGGGRVLLRALLQLRARDAEKGSDLGRIRSFESNLKKWKILSLNLFAEFSECTHNFRIQAIKTLLVLLENI